MHKFLSFYFALHSTCAIFACVWFGKDVLPLPIKRESGANPEQSRCCEAPFLHYDKHKPLTKVGKASGEEQVRRPAIQPKGTSHSWVRAGARK